MPGINFAKLRQEISMRQVLHLLHFAPTHRTGDQWYGHCPLHESDAARRRTFSVNVRINCYYCHKCKSHGDQFSLWANASNKTLYTATIDLCTQLSIAVPWVNHG